MAIGKLRGKKKWFTVLAPEIFKSRELVDITAYEPIELKGRPVESNLAQLSDKPKDQYKKIILKIIDTKGEKAITEPWKFYLVESFVQRSARRYRERLPKVFKLQSKDKKLVKIKLFILAVKKLHHSVRADLLKLVEDKLTPMILKSNAYDLFLPDNLEKLSGNLVNEVKNIYPVDKILVWKIFVL